MNRERKWRVVQNALTTFYTFSPLHSFIRRSIVGKRTLSRCRRVHHLPGGFFPTVIVCVFNVNVMKLVVSRKNCIIMKVLLLSCFTICVVKKSIVRETFTAVYSSFHYLTSCLYHLYSISQEGQYPDGMCRFHGNFFGCVASQFRGTTSLEMLSSSKQSPAFLPTEKGVCVCDTRDIRIKKL